MRRKIFGMIAVPLDRNEKARLLHRARAMMRATEKGKHYGAVSAKTYAVLCAILMQFHNCRSGRAFPSYDAIQEAAGRWLLSADGGGCPGRPGRMRLADRP